MVIREREDYQPGPDRPISPTEELLQSRRAFLKRVIRGSYIAFAVAFALPALALRTLTQELEEIVAGDVLVSAGAIAGGPTEGQPININDLEVGQAVQAFPQGKSNNSKNIIQLIRLGEEAAADSVVAYSAICTHLGCTVLPNLTEDGLIACPCHASFFNPAEDAQVVAGPANRPLPTLPVTVGDDGVIVAEGPFDDTVGAL